MDTQKVCNLVMEGGGVKGLALVGAAHGLSKNGYSFQRIAGTSSGAVVGSLLAAGYTTVELKEIMTELEYRKFRDEGIVDRLGLPGKTASLLIEKGVYEGKYLRNWLYQKLAAKGITTFESLKMSENISPTIPADQRYKLAVVATDITRGRLVRFPWDYTIYGLDPDTQLVADAVRASISIPFFYEPVKLGGNYIVDGGVLSNFSIDIFDTTPSQPIETIGIKLSAKEDINLSFNKINDSLDLARAVINTMLSAQDQRHINNPETLRRTMFVDTLQVKPLDFDITPMAQMLLYEQGLLAVDKFLSRPRA